MSKKVEDYICTLEQAKKLRELGVEQNSIFTWALIKDPYIHTPRYYIAVEKSIINDCDYSAFTSQELWEITNVLFPQKNIVQLLADCNGHLTFQSHVFNESCENEAHARAEFLIQLLREKK